MIDAVQQDREIRGRWYQVLVVPLDMESPAGKTLAVFADNDATPIYTKIGIASETEQTLMEEGWAYAQHHANRY
jgi:hypothetical protein